MVAEVIPWSCPFGICPTKLHLQGSFLVQSFLNMWRESGKNETWGLKFQHEKLGLSLLFNKPLLHELKKKVLPHADKKLQLGRYISY